MTSETMAVPNTVVFYRYTAGNETAISRTSRRQGHGALGRRAHVVFVPSLAEL